MADTVLVTKTRGADRHLVVTDKGEVAAELTAREYADLALPGAGAPRGVSRADWESGKAVAIGGVRDYGGGQTQLAHGEIAELSDRFEVGVILRANDAPTTVTINKSDVTVSRAGGLTLTKQRAEAWPDAITSIDAGVLRTR